MKRPPLFATIVVVPVVALLVLHLMGARAWLGILSGTQVDPARAVLALTYALAWFGVVVTAPIVVLARLLLLSFTWVRTWRSSRAR